MSEKTAAGMTTSDEEDPFAHLQPAKFLQSCPSQELSSILQQEGKEIEAYFEEVMKFIHRPRPKYYAIALDTDLNKKKRERCKFDFFKEEAMRFLEGIGGSLWAEKFIAQYKVAVGNVFICRLLEDEVIIVQGKDEVLSVRHVPQDNRLDRPLFDPSPPQPFCFGRRRPDPYSAFQAC